MTSHHPEHDQLLEYSAGSLSPSLALCISVHIEYCEQCRMQLQKLDAIGGMMLEQLDTEEHDVDDALFDSIMSKIDTKMSTSAAQVAIDYEHSDEIPAAVKKLIAYDLEALSWKRHGPNVKSAALIDHNDLKASLIRIKKGATIPQHGHKGREFTVILDGAFSDKDGVYQRGDFLIRDAGEEHSPTATKDKDCLCLAVLEAPLHFKNPLVEVFNRISPL